MVKGVGARAPQPTNPRSQQKTKQKQKNKNKTKTTNKATMLIVKVWARVHHNRPIPDHLLQAAIKSLDVAPDKIEPAPRISDVLMET